jgi:hypothetical protein
VLLSLFVLPGKPVRLILLFLLKSTSILTVVSSARSAPRVPGQWLQVPRMD